MFIRQQIAPMAIAIFSIRWFSAAVILQKTSAGFARFGALKVPKPSPEIDLARTP
jgi:hypothetical protein